MTKKNKNKKDWYDTHVEVLSFGSSTQDKKLKSLLKQKIKEDLIKTNGGI